jgi:hypothetical protein
MLKLELEVIARGGLSAAAFKYSVAAIRVSNTVSVSAIELSKEVFANGANFDVDITEDGASISLIAKGWNGAGTAYWNAQVVKMMKMDSTGVALEAAR